MEGQMARLRTDLLAATQDREIEGEHAKLVSALLEQREQQCEHLAVQNEMKSETVNELEAILRESEKDKELRDSDVYVSLRIPVK